VVDFTGDNFLAEFPTALEAVRCVVAVQRVLGALNTDLPADRKMEFRMGIHLGDVRAEEGRLYGSGVNIAARLEGLAEPGGICISSAVRDQVRHKLDVGFVDLGDQTVKNIPDPVRVYRILLSRRSEPSAETAPDEDPLLALPTGPVVAILPFDNLSGDPDQEYFSDGLTDGIITALTRFKDLYVIARNSTFRYKGQPVDVRRLSRELGARYVLEGSVQRAGTTLRVTAQLLDAKDGTHLWAETYDRELSASSIFAVQDGITEQVVATIAGHFGVISRARFAEVKENPTDRLDAYECVLQTDAYYRDNMVAAEHARVRDALERVVRSDPSYSDAWACLATIYTDEYRWNYSPRPDPLDRALGAARRAVASDPASQRARMALANVHFHRHELDAFFAEAERAIALNPNNAATMGSLGEKLHYAGDERGIVLVRRAAKLDPFHPTRFNFPIAHYHFEKGEYEEALAAARKIDISGFFLPQIYLAAIYAELGRRREAQSALQELRRLWPGATVGTLIKQLQKWNYHDDSVRHWAAALRKAGLPE
jgi:adenylate cyclase